MECFALFYDNGREIDFKYYSVKQYSGDKEYTCWIFAAVSAEKGEKKRRKTSWRRLDL